VAKALTDIKVGVPVKDPQPGQPRFESKIIAAGKKFKRTKEMFSDEQWDELKAAGAVVEDDNADFPPPAMEATAGSAARTMEGLEMGEDPEKAGKESSEPNAARSIKEASEEGA
jgi:hypothetical protein